MIAVAGNINGESTNTDVVNNNPSSPAAPAQNNSNNFFFYSTSLDSFSIKQGKKKEGKKIMNGSIVKLSFHIEPIHMLYS